MEAVKERRCYVSDVRAVEPEGDRKKKKLKGYAARFDSPSVNLGWFTETITPGAFKESLARGDDVYALIEHSGGMNTIGRTKSGTLSLSEDDIGLLAEIDLPDTPDGQGLYELVSRGDLSHMSFAFSVLPDGQEWKDDDKGNMIRVLRKVRLYDVSVVNYPAYPATNVETNSVREQIAEILAMVNARRSAKGMPAVDAAGLPAVSPTAPLAALWERQLESELVCRE